MLSWFKNYKHCFWYCGFYGLCFQPPGLQGYDRVRVEVGARAHSPKALISAQIPAHMEFWPINGSSEHYRAVIKKCNSHGNCGWCLQQEWPQWDMNLTCSLLQDFLILTVWPMYLYVFTVWVKNRVILWSCPGTGRVTVSILLYGIIVHFPLVILNL